MLITLYENQTVFDLCFLINGNCDNIIQFMNDINIDQLDSDLSGQTFDLIYNTNDRTVNNFLLNLISVTTGDLNTFNELNSINTTYEYSTSGFDFEAFD